MPRNQARLALLSLWWQPCRLRLSSLLLFLLASLALPSAHATITWSSGTHTVLANTTLQDSSIIITGGTNTVQGAAGPPAQGAAGVLQLTVSVGAGLEMTGASLTLNSDATLPGKLFLQWTLTSHASGVTSTILSGGAGAVPGTIDMNFDTRTFSVESGSVPSTGPDLSLATRITNGGLNKTGPGILALSGANTYSGGTTLNAGTLYINSSTAIGTGDLNITGPGTSIDNRSGGPIALSNNNPLNLTGGDLTFTGTNDLNFGNGFSVIANANRSINIVNPAATLTLGGAIGDNGQNRMLTTNGPGTLVLGGNSLYTGGTTVAGGTMVLNGSTSSGVSVSNGATFANNGTVGGNVSVSGTMTGAGTVNGSLVINNGGIVDVMGGTFTVHGGVTNNGLFILSNGAQIAGVTGFINNGTLDLITAGAFNPPNFTNNGTIINSGVVKTKSVSKAGSTISVSIDSYTGHTYQLQKSTTTPAGGNFTTNIGPSQNGTTGTVLTLTDPAATASPSFYRILVSP